MTKKQRLVVVGNGMVGHKHIEYLVDMGATEYYDIHVYGEEPRPAYDRVHLSEYFSGRSADDLSLVDAGFYDQPGLTLHLKQQVTHIDTAQQRLTLANGSQSDYDQLVLATGSYPFVPPIPGNDRDGCLVYRTIEDLDAIAAAGKNGQVGVVVGGGLLGLEAANALHALNLETHVVEFAPNLMAMQIDDGAGAMLKHKIGALGVQVHTQKNTQCIIDGTDHTHRMVFTDDTELEADVIVFSAGIRPQDALGRVAGLTLGSRGGIAVNDYCQTSQPNIYAIGECCVWQDTLYGLVAPGYQMAKVAAEQLLAAATTANPNCGSFTGADMSTKLKLLGVDVASIGDAHARTAGAQAYTFIDEANQVYKKLVVNAERTKVIGAVLLGDVAAYGNLLQMKLNDMALPEQPEALILPSVDGASVGLGVDALPDTAQICSCNDVSKAAICSVISNGEHSVASIKACTQASAACGGCAPLVKQLLDAELEKQGITVDKSLCEHFAYSRQELEHLIRFNNIKTFHQLINSHGQGKGCEICKPTAASIFASTWNEHIMQPQHFALQDTNDRFMANMQKNGTYSVVPRIPGGEITPDKLIVLGEVAKQFNLYTKITGGQRIDLFGAQLHELPPIWEQLIAAGFETGQAYAKSVRTVKSCVGSSWCRFGVQDSVSMAIFIEERYKGLRSPHKLKFAVSGCTRECAEAQSKDIGVIATEKGWNLYVAGNGGMKPRHADLFASDLDDATLIRYIDRFLMFYIRTAERLQRTSVWMDNLEGGLEYMQQVVCEDSLGLGEDLSQQMQHIVDTFQCEWKTTLDNPEQIQRFRHLVNSKASDAKQLFVEERGQLRPATADEAATEQAQEKYAFDLSSAQTSKPELAA